MMASSCISTHARGRQRGHLGQSAKFNASGGPAAEPPAVTWT